MAVTKIKEIRSTLGKAIDYICNPEKTEGMLLVDSFHCSPATAAVQMELTAGFGTGLGNRKAYHLIQSFAPGEITPGKALEIGKQYADLVTGGRHEYVVAAHNDGEHIHTHIIFNSVSFENYRKYHHGAEDVQRIRDLSDRLCIENNLPVIEKTSGRKGRNHAGNPWVERLADLIDNAVLESRSYEDFLEKMGMEGAAVKQGKHISFKCELLGQERFCRGKTIGPGYTEEAIRARIERDEKYLSENRLKSPEEMRAWKARREASGYAAPESRKSISAGTKNSRNINGLIDTRKHMESGKGMAYINKLEEKNIENFLKFMGFMQEHSLLDADSLTAYETGQKTQINALNQELESKIQQRKAHQKKYENVRDYIRYRRCYTEYKRGGSQAEFRNRHQTEIEGFLKAEAYLKSAGLQNPGGNMLKEILENELAPLNAEIKELRRAAYDQKLELQKTAAVRQIYEQTYGVKLETDNSIFLKTETSNPAASRAQKKEDVQR